MPDIWERHNLVCPVIRHTLRLDLESLPLKGGRHAHYELERSQGYRRHKRLNSHVTPGRTTIMRTTSWS